MALTKIKVAAMAANSVDSDQYVDASIDTAHIGDDQVTADKLANSINTEIAANTAKVTNATHTGDVTGGTTLTIAADAVETAMIEDDAVTADKLANAINTDIAAKAPSASPTFTGTVTTANVSTDGQYIQQEETLTVSSNATTVDCSTGNYFTVTASGNVTFTFGTVPADTKSYAMVIEVNHDSGTLTWPAAVKWPADTAPTLTTGKTHQFYFHTNDNGSRWRGGSLVDYVD